MPNPFFNFQGNAGLSVLAFLGTGFLLFVTSTAVLYCIATRRFHFARRFVLVGLVIGAVYIAALLGFSFSSHDQVLGPGDAKYFCEVDCHLAYSLSDVFETPELKTPSGTVNARGTFYVATVKTWFDERTISPRRGNGLLTPNPRAVWVIDDAGHPHGISIEGQRALELAGSKSAPLTQPLRPGESYTTTLVFDVPSDITSPRLLIVETNSVTRLLIGHENSFFHKKAYFRLAPRKASATSALTD